MDTESKDKSQQELHTLTMYYDTVLSTLESGVLVMDSNDIIISENEKVLKLWELSGKMSGQKLQNTELWQQCPELKKHLEESRKGQPSAVHFECDASPSTILNITIKPILPESGGEVAGTLIYMEDVTRRASLQSTMEQLETIAEQLQSANEELEFTSGELQSLNDEMRTMSEELASRTRQLDEMNAGYSEMMERMPWPVLLVDQEGLICMFNSAAQKLFGFAEPSEGRVKLEELPMDNRSRQALLGRHRSAVQTQKQVSVRGMHLVTNRFDGAADVHFTPLSKDNEKYGVIIMFEVQEAEKQRSAARTAKKAAVKSRNAGPAKKKAKKKKSR